MKNRITYFFPSLNFSSPFLTFLFPLLLTFLTLFAGSVASAQVPSNGLVGYWPFNGNANDESGNGNNGTVNGGALLVTDRNGNVNAAYQFDGIDDFIQMTQAGPTGNTAVTVSFWMRTTMAVNNGPGEGIGHVFGYGANDINQPGRSFNITVNGSAWVNSCNQAITFDTHGAALSKTDVFNNSWNHYSIVNDPSSGDNVINQKIYKNGVLMSQTCYSSPGVPANPTNFSNAAPIRIGKFYGNNCANCQVGIPYFFQGALDDFSMYNRVLTPSEITQLYTDQTSTVATPPCPTLATNLQTGLVGYWPFCGNANDESGNGNNGTVNGATLTTDRFGNANSAYGFDGNGNFISLADIDLVNNGTLVCWVKPNGSLGSLISKYGNGNESYEFIYNNSSHGLYGHVGTVTNANNNIYSEEPLLLNVWHCCVLVIDNGTAKIFLDGNLIHSQAQVNSIFQNNDIVLLGKSVWGGNLFSGLLDDISIYNRALSPAEITQLYTDPSVELPPCPTLATNLQTGLVGYWPFCGNANDESGNGNNGTVLGGASLTTDRFGNLNSAFLIDGLNCSNPRGVSIPVNILNDEYTFSVWCKSSDSTKTNQTILNTFPHNILALSLNYSLPEAQNKMCSFYGNGYWIDGGNIINWPSYQKENWKHFIVVKSQTQIAYYENGILVFNQPVNSLGNPVSISSIICGAISIMGGSACYETFKGKVDDLIIWNRALTPNEITQLYTDPSVTPPVPCTPFLGEDQTVCAGTSVTLSASGSSLACPALPSTLQNGLVGYWPFCGNANDASGNGNNGTVNGATLTTDRFGNVNSAFSLSGTSNSILVNDSPSLDFPQGVFSLCAEVKLSGLGVEQGLIDHLDVGGPSVLSRYTLRVLPNNKIRFNLKDDENDWSSVDSDISLDINVWYSIVGVFNYATQELHIYINGEIHDGTIIYNSLTGPAITPPNSLFIGNFAGAYNLNGTIDNVSIYNRALSSSEIQQLYTLGQSTYLWSTGATTANISVTPLQTTTYTCTVTDANGNACTDSVTVFVPQIEATDLTICAGESTTLSVSGINSTTTPSACPTLPTNLQTGLVGYWPFCGNANDASGNGNNGTVNGATLTTDRFGNANSAYSFDGNSSKIIVSNSPSLEMGFSNYSLSAWVKTNSQNVINGRIISKGSSSCITGYMMRTGWPNSSKLYTENAYNLNCFVSNSSIASINNNQWRLAVVTIERNVGVKFYIDGVLDSEYSVNSLNDISNGQDLFFGYNNLSNSIEPFSGQIDDISIYNRALTPSEIQQLYTLGQTTYLWSNGATTPTIDVSPTTTTTYTCTVTTNGVTCTDSVTVVVNNPILDLGSDVTACGTSTTLTAPTGYDSYAWSNGGTTNSTTVNTNGIYTCTVTQGGCSATEAVDVTLVNATVTATDSTICAGQTITLSVPQGGSSSTACSALPSNLQTGLVGYWPFCGNANDASGNGNNGTVTGATLTTDRFGNANNAYSFDGNDFVEVPSTPSLNCNNALSINAWILSTSASGSEVAVSKERHPGGTSYNLAKESGGYALGINNQPFGGNCNSACNLGASSAGSVLSNNWQYVTGVWDGQTCKLYLNGTLVSTATGALSNGGLLVSSTLPVFFGKWMQSYDPSWGFRYFNGKIDDIAIHNRALTPSEIQQLYTFGQTTYLWSNGATTPTINVSPTTTTTYTCTVTTNGVTCTDSVTVVVNNPTIDLGSDVTACGTSTTLTAPSGYDSYVWSNGGTTYSTTVNTNGTYTCTASIGGCSASDAVDVTLIDATITASDSIICAGEIVNLEVMNCPSLSGNLDNGLVGFWPFCGNANDESGNNFDGVVAGANLTADRFGSQNSAYQLNGANSQISTPFLGILGGNSRTISFWADVDPFVSEITVIQYGSSSSANGGTDRFGCKFANNGTPSVGIDIDGSQVTYAFPNLFNGWHLFTYTFSSLDVNSINNVRIYADGNLLTTLTQNYIPFPAAALLNTTADLPLTFGGNQYNNVYYNGFLDDVAVYNRALSSSEIQELFTLNSSSYEWSTGATTPTINVSPNITTTYTCTVTTNGVSCTYSVTVVVNNPTLNLGSDVTACGTSTTLTAPTGYDSYAWSNGATANSTTVNTNGTYTCTVTQGGCSASDAVDVTLIDATISATDSVICAGETTTLSVPQGGSSNTGCAALPTNLQNGLVGYWPFCGNANDASGNGNNGTVNGATLTTDRFGNANSAYSFDGVNDLINVPYNAAFNMQQSTWSFWVNKLYTAPSSGEFIIGYSDNQLHHVSNILVGDSCYSQIVGSTWPGVQNHAGYMGNNSWHLMTIVYDQSLPSNNFSLFLDGTFIRTISLLLPLNFNTNSQLRFGYPGNNLQFSPFNGKIDDARIYNRVLSLSEIQQLFTLGQTTYLWSNGATTPTINVSPTTTTTYTCTVTTNGVSCTDSVTVVVGNPVASITPNGIVEICQGQSIALTGDGGVSYLWSTGAPTQSITVNTEAVYTVTVTDANGCTDTESQLVKVNFLPNIGVNNAAICPGQSATLTATGGISYVWSPATGLSATTGTTVTASPATSTVYTVTGTGANGCTNTATAAVAVNALPTATITPASATTFCQGGSVVLNANTGTGLSYQWFNNATAISGATSASYTASMSGSYTVVVTNASTCSSTSTATVVTVNALPAATITASSATTFCQGGSVVLNANTGAGLSYQWRLNGNPISGATSSSYTATTSGSYTVVVTNASACSSTSTATVVTVNALPTATITPATATTFCQGGSVVLNANTGAGLSYQWRLNGNPISGATSSSYTANASGSYTVVVTNTSTCSSTSTATVVTVNALPTATITPATATTFCQGGSVVLNANTGTGLSYQWFNNANPISGATSSSYTANASGSYTVVVTNASTCSITSTATVVTVNALPTATITPATATTFCQGGSVVLNANTGAGLSYQWRLNGNPISGATSSSYTANASGSYTVVVTNVSNCSSTSTATVVTVNALPTATITAATATTFCQGGSVVLNANTEAGLTYQWRLNGNPISGATSSSYTANASGSYTVVVTNASTCSSTSTATVVTVNALPTATITPATSTTFCQGGSVVLNANTGAGLSYQWRLNGNPISGATSSSYTANASGSYTVVVTNASTCSSTSTATVVTVNPLPTATITPATATTFCQGGSVVLNANTGAGLSYQWRLNGNPISGATSSSYTANASGSYTVVVTNASTCSITSTATVVTVNALPTATITPATATTFCQGGSVVLNANTGAGLSYQWYNNASIISGATSASYTATTSGSYTVTVTNASTCSSTSTATVVTVNALPVASISPNGLVEICEGQSIALTANGGVSYLWSTGAPTQSITVSTEALYTVTVTDINGCTDTESQFVKVNQLPNIAVNNASICAGLSATLTATGGLSYVWSPATGLSATTGSIVTSSTTTNTVYTVTGTGANGCTNSATATVTVNALPTATITPATATTFCQGESVVLNANTGIGLSYQWFNNAIAISGATGASYTATTSGSYTLVVTNASTCSSTSTAIDVIAVPNVDYFADADGDGFGDITTLISTCVQPQGYVTNSSDCNDNNAAIFPGAQEICNDIDDDCNQLIDDSLVFITYYADVDGDSFGDINNPLDACVMPDGYVTNSTDCNDNNVNQNAASAEICNGEDDDCDGAIDNGLVFLDYYSDVDGDGFGSGDVTSSCTDLGAGYVSNNTDCDDSNSNTNPSATEICNTIDDNCDGQIDEGVQTVYFIDNDGDTYGNPSVSILACTQPIGYTPDDTDCNDTDASINPGAEDIGGNGIDENCDGEIDNSIFELNASINLFPNPTRSELNIQITNALVGNEMFIFDAVGKLVYKQQLLSTQTTIPVSNFADGNYIVRVGELVKRFEVIK